MNTTPLNQKGILESRPKYNFINLSFSPDLLITHTIAGH